MQPTVKTRVQQLHWLMERKFSRQPNTCLIINAPEPRQTCEWKPSAWLIDASTDWRYYNVLRATTSLWNLQNRCFFYESNQPRKKKKSIILFLSRGWRSTALAQPYGFSVRLYHSRIHSIEHLDLRFPSVTSEECALSNDNWDEWTYFLVGLVWWAERQPAFIHLFLEKTVRQRHGGYTRNETLSIFSVKNLRFQNSPWLTHPHRAAELAESFSGTRRNVYILSCLIIFSPELQLTAPLIPLV